ncbi:MAG TPA: cupin [Patescibacteria group bacterium]|nr:cupin [Patescibacteria group bacterium]
MDIDEFLKTRDLSSYTNLPFIKKVPKPWGYELIFTPDGLAYTGKIIHIEAGKRLSLQVHDKKQESYFLAKGKGGVMLENTQGELERIELEENQGYTVAVGQKHRLFGITDCDIFEASTPESGTTYRLEDDYQRPNETEELRQDPNRGWNS